MIGSPSTPALNLTTRSDLHIEAEISTEDLAKVKAGMVVSVTSPGLPGLVFRGRVERLSAAGELKRDAAIRTRIVRARVRVADWSALRPGMEVDVEGSTELKKALSVPTDCVAFDEKGSFVWIVRAGKAERRNVRMGYSTATRAEVLEGLRSGEQLVLRGKETLQEGSAVTVAP
jgi:RND family efflux transporter MFP subunit